jgi:hypothetical protein
MRAAKPTASLVLLAVAALPHLARAEAPVCDAAMALRVNQSGLDFIVDMAKPLIPSQIDVPPISQVVVDWPVTDSDAEVVITGTTASITLHKLLAQMDNGALRIQGEADVVAGGPVIVNNPYVGLGTANCQADVQLRNLSLDLSLALGTEAGNVKATVNHAKISIDHPASVIALKGCTLGKVLTAVVDFVRKHFSGVIQSKLEQIAKEKLSALIASKLGETIQITKELQGFSFTGRLDGVATDDAGVAVSLGVGVDLSAPANPPCLAGANLTPPAACVGVPAQVSPAVDAMFGAGLSEAVLNQGLHAVWRSGKACVDSRSLALPTVAQGMDKLASALGQPAGTQLGFTLRMLEPPRIAVTPQSGVELQARALELALSLTPPDGPAGGALIRTDLAIGGIPWIDPAGNMVSLDLRKVAFNKLEVLGQGGAPSPLKLDPARLQRFISTVAMPVLRERLASAPLTASVVGVLDYLVELKAFQAHQGYFSAHVDVHHLVANGDKGAPETQLVEGPDGEVGPQVLRLVVGGVDNRTPSALLRYRARVDDGTWSEPSYGGRVDVTVVGGAHVVQVAAVDHDGNIDPSPLVVPVRVDDVMPQLVITSRPDSMVTEDWVEVTFAGRDDRTPADKLTYTVELLRVPDGGGMPEVVRTVAVDPRVRAARLEGVPDGVYTVRVIVADGVGNVTSEDVGFVVAADVGCSLAPARSLPRPLLSGAFLLLLPLILRIRRRRPRR